MEDPRKPRTLALAPVLIFAAVLIAVFGAALVTTFDHQPAVVAATDIAPPGTTGMAKLHTTTDRR
ncbi:hypothetical protein BH10PSE11_BH10PSE11_37660 [soil metagenome]